MGDASAQLTDEELARIKTAWSSDRQRTHSEGCRQWHPECAVVVLAGEVERLRADLADVIRLLVDEHDTHHENCCVEPDDMCHVGQVLARIEGAR